MRILLVFGVVGQLLRLFSVMFAVPTALAVFDGGYEAAARFAVSGVLAFILGMLLARGLNQTKTIHRAEAFGVVAFSWAAIATTGAVPYVMYGLSPIDALFESMSGFTTTGATVLVDFSKYDRAFFLWRAMTQWFGGLGVIALFIVVLPRLGIAGRQLFFAEASGAPSEAVSPQVRKSASRLWLVYVALTVALISLLMMVARFDWFEALTHALTTISAGGFSPNPESIAGYHNANAEWILTPFMLLSGTSFTLLFNALTARPLALLKDGEFLFYAGIMAAAALLLSLILGNGAFTVEAVRLGAFQAASLMSSTGFASDDYNVWSDPARAVLIIVMLVGGCAGSAAGGPKSIRLLLVFKHALREITTTLHPRAVLALRYKGSAVSPEIMRSVFTLVVLFMLGHFVVGTVLVLMGSDLVLGYTAALACLGNIGPAFGTAGPMGTFAAFSVAAKLLLTLAMWVGRLEIVAVLALLHLDVLRNLQLR